MFKKGETLRALPDDGVKNIKPGTLVRVIQKEEDFHPAIASEGYEGLIMVTLPEYYDELKDLNAEQLFNRWLHGGTPKKSWIYYMKSFELVVGNHHNKRLLKRL